MAEPDNNDHIEEADADITSDTAGTDADTDNLNQPAKPTKLVKKIEMSRYIAETKENMNLTWCCVGILVIMILVYLLARMLTDAESLNGGK